MPPFGHRPYRTHTKIGRLMLSRNLRAKEVSDGSGVYTRSMSDILAGKRPSQRNLALLCEFFKLPPEKLTEDEYPWTVERQEAKAKRIAEKRAMNEGVKA